MFELLISNDIRFGKLSFISFSKPLFPIVSDDIAIYFRLAKNWSDKSISAALSPKQQSRKVKDSAYFTCFKISKTFLHSNI